MTPRALAVIGGCLVLLVAVWIGLFRDRIARQSGAPGTTARQTAPSPAAKSVAASSSPRGSAATPPAPRPFPSPAYVARLPVLPAPTGKTAEALSDLDKINRMFLDYRTLMHENPVGTNAEIMKAVMGGNPKHAKLGPPEGMSLNDKGELLDRWGTPIFFHQLSGTHMEVRSAGPDKIFGTGDDLILK